jgi:hypothetical protein
LLCRQPANGKAERLVRRELSPHEAVEALLGK